MSASLSHANPDGTGKLEAYDEHVGSRGYRGLRQYKKTRESYRLQPRKRTGRKRSTRVPSTPIRAARSGGVRLATRAGRNLDITGSGTTGTTVSITNLKGTGFYGTPTSSSEERKDDNGYKLSVVSPTRITCKFAIPATASPGSWDLYVQNLTPERYKDRAFTITANMLPARPAISPKAPPSPLLHLHLHPEPQLERGTRLPHHMTTSSTVSGVP